jgi:hypothetical protein
MTIRHALSVCALLGAALLLSGCFVISKELPKGAGAAIDERLVGAWQGLDSSDGEPDDVYLHFLEPEPGKPLRLVWVEGKSFQVYEMRTGTAGARTYFAATLIQPVHTADEDIPKGHYLGFYEVTGDEAVFHLLDSKKTGALIKRGVVKGSEPPRTYDMATLSGSPEDVAKFLASPDAYAARSDEPARMRRLSPAKKN